MATNFPASLDTLTNPTSSDSLSSPSHSAQHANVNDAVEALQAKVGVDSSAVTSSLDYKVADHASRITTLEGASGGKILQVVQQTRSTATSTTAGTFVSTGLTATITPTSATSTILVISHLPCRGNSTTWGHTVYRGDVATGTELTGVANGFGDHDAGRTVGIGLIVDSPATTSATTYTQAFRSSNANAFLSSIRMGSLTLMEISA